MVSKDDRYSFAIPFIDVLLTMALIAWCLTVLMTLIPPKPDTPPKDSNIKLKAEIVLSMSWPDDSIDDVDLWLMLPDGKSVWYGQKDREYATLDRDDRGATGEVFWKSSDRLEKGLTRSNREIITIRALVPGRYVVAAHMFATYTSVDEFKATVPLPYDATLEVTKLNPNVEVVAKASVRLTKLSTIANFLAFRVTPEGEVVDIEAEPQDTVVKLKEIFGG